MATKPKAKTGGCACGGHVKSGAKLSRSEQALLTQAVKQTARTGRAPGKTSR